jgi:hypothetical protein
MKQNYASNLKRYFQLSKSPNAFFKISLHKRPIFIPSVTVKGAGTEGVFFIFRMLEMRFLDVFIEWFFIQYFVSISFLVFRVSTSKILFGLASFQSFKQN